MCCLVVGQIGILSGCAVWPTMTRPAVQISVRDLEGRPVDGASFHFATYSISMVPRSSVWKVDTDQRGIVAFDSEREWQFFFLAPDSGQFWSWSWCIEKRGFQTVLVNDLRANGRAKDAEIVLTPGAEEQRCIWREHPPAFEVHHGAL